MVTWIPGFIDHGGIATQDCYKIDMNTYLLLINALYFKGMWKHSFDKNKTFDKSFYVDNNTPKNVPTMQVTSEIFYKSHEGLGAEIVRLPYQMGIKDAFTSKANFHGITEQNDISISKVIQQAFIEVNEDGTKAAAATHMGIMPLSAYGGPLDIHVNRPFLFLLATERVILFTGYVNDPTTK
ncbi:serine protease inhibitor-like [Aphidius gifuensis]|uniref:serine protease inhibitor-like n=1 Tax=Aphidius gifuensis TaxID=684658 RepID=UPI001CDD0732|nr:serine protease inhibitor-like [Aphidius gifuensis]